MHVREKRHRLLLLHFFFSSPLPLNFCALLAHDSEHLRTQFVDEAARAYLKGKYPSALWQTNTALELVWHPTYQQYATLTRMSLSQGETAVALHLCRCGWKEPLFSICEHILIRYFIAYLVMCTFLFQVKRAWSSYCYYVNH